MIRAWASSLAGAASAAVVTIAATTALAGGGRVALGDYQASPTAPATITIGVFSVAKVGGKRRIVPSERFSGIYYPDNQKCDDFDLPLAAESIPISSEGRFRIKERTPIGQTAVRVDWKGHWTEPGVVAGAITIRHEGCRSRRRWSGGVTRGG